ncbi:baseplate J/gp47 family protein [Roseomonas sp. F4]
MATFPRPTLSALRQQGRAEIAALLAGFDPTLPRSILGVLSDAQAALLHQQYGYLDFIAGQTIPDTAEAEYLDRWCRIVGLVRKPASFAGGNVTLSGSAGTVPAGTRLLRSDGVAYLTQADATLVASAATVAVLAEADGIAGNVGAGAELALGLAIPGIIGVAVVAAGGLAGGAAEEADAELRERLRARLATPPQGGAASDYVAWALTVSGVTRAWAYPLNRGAGTVDIAFVMDGRTDIIPLSGDVAAVQSVIDVLRPVTADALVFAPVAAPLAITITGLSPDTAAVRAAIVAQLAAQIARDAEPGGTIRKSRLVEAVSRAAGEAFHTMTVPSGDVTHAAGVIAIPGTVTFA